ncbi:MAG: amidohydrolase family protein, partial [Candidatus Atribacteria bacterium]|nr:amidohydrolase family protein [Candidatus Atribacteria bacterium]
CHDHVTENFGMEYDCEEERKIVSSLRAANNCLNILKSGITTVRDAGAKYAVNLKVRDAIKNGLIDGPDIIAAGNRISRTGYPKYTICREADGIDEVRKAVREEQKDGADFIKLMITGVGAGNPVQSEYSKAEIMAGIEEAHNLGLTIGVHAHGGLAATYAIQGGVDIVEHGTYLTDNDFEEMKRKKIFLVITLPVLRHFKDLNELSSLSNKEVKGEFKKSYLELVSLIRKVREYRILFSLGGDNHHGDPTGNMKALLDSGFACRSNSYTYKRQCKNMWIREY